MAEVEIIPDPTAPICALCGARVHDPCQTEAEQESCALPDFCFPDGRRMIKHATPDLPSPESCPHRFTEMVTAAHADGMCPLCMAARIEQLEAALKCIEDHPHATGEIRRYAEDALVGKEG